MKRTFILLLGLFLVMSMHSVGVADGRPSWEMLQEEFNQLISRIEHGNEVLAACQEYLDLLDTTSDTEKLKAAADKIEGIVGTDLILRGEENKSALIEKYRDIYKLYVESNQALLIENLNLQADYWLEMIDEKQDARKTYPFGSTSKYLVEAIRGIPEIIHTTKASENGLVGTVYYDTGTVIEALDEIVPSVLIDMNGRNIMVANAVASSPVFEKLEPGSDYSMPIVGEMADMYLTYVGFSWKHNVPAFYLGANEALVDSLRNPAG